ncbi:MAG: VCBS repeat-containing protein [Bacteroidota bacterium]
MRIREGRRNSISAQRMTLVTLFALLFLVKTTSSTAQCAEKEPIFELLSPKKTGVTFANNLNETGPMNFLSTTFFYNGGGVAVGDLNNDGLPEIFLSANQKDSRLYLNRGKLKFEDVTKVANIIDDEGQWATGVNMADVNADGWLDIYVCYTSVDDPETRTNRLYINQQDMTFREEAAAYGLDDTSYSTHSAFFDYDLDGDLDVYLLNYNADHIPVSRWEHVKKTRDPYAGDKLYRNDAGRFIDVSEEAGIKGNPLGFGLGIAVSDVNLDGFPDVYVSNDFVEPDYLYINNGDGTFSDQMPSYFQHVSHFSMGSDIRDINNDGYPDLFTIDMLPADNKRQKLLYGPDNYEEYARRVMSGYYHQSMRNMLHVNNANGTFSEIGQLAGISNTDWSWSSLFADYDSDGWKDLYITNGYYKDVTDRDFLKFKGDYYFNQQVNRARVDTTYLVENTRSTPLSNYAFRNNGGLSFEDRSECWGIDKPGFSNGAAYGDLDNDGDLDLVVNNINAKAWIYENKSTELLTNNYINIRLSGNEKWPHVYNSKVFVYSEGQLQFQELMPVRGFQSRVQDILHFGLGSSNKVDSIRVQWNDRTTLLIEAPNINQTLTLQKQPSSLAPVALRPKETLFQRTSIALDHRHEEYPINDFKRQPLLLTMLSTCGPVMDMADVDGNGTQDLYLGSSKNVEASLVLQNEDGSFSPSAIQNDKVAATEADVLFFDADGDGDPDIYAGSGGYHDYFPKDDRLQDRLLLNDGAGVFTLATNALPKMTTSTGCVEASDYDQDGDLDLFVGSRVIPGQYPVTPESYILNNDGKGNFSKVQGLPESLSLAGMVTDAVWVELDGQAPKELIVVGEFMPIRIFGFDPSLGFRDLSTTYLPEAPSGLWSALVVADFDGDGDDDLVVGNFGQNSQLKASKERPMTLVYGDFDDNGSIDPIVSYYIEGKSYPFASRDEMTNQMISLRKEFQDYQSYAEAQIDDILTKSQLQSAGQLQVTELSTLYLENRQGQLMAKPLPIEAQISPVFAMKAMDFNGDGHQDVLLAGNQSFIRIRLGLVDASYGKIFLGDGTGNFQNLPQVQSGLKVVGDVRSIVTPEIGGKKHLIFGINNSTVEAYKSASHE